MLSALMEECDGSSSRGDITDTELEMALYDCVHSHYLTRMSSYPPSASYKAKVGTLKARKEHRTTFVFVFGGKAYDTFRIYLRRFGTSCYLVPLSSP